MKKLVLADICKT